jgi:hypothetical protein
LALQHTVSSIIAVEISNHCLEVCDLAVYF